MKPSASVPNKKLRLQVFLSHNGVCSRREAMELVQKGRVKLNGQTVTEPSTPVDGSRDSIEVDGKIIQEKTYEYILLNKPSGYVTTTEDIHADKTVLDLLPEELRYLNPVGRLDQDTEGLLLLTNDGDVAFRLTHPSFNVDKVYLVHIDGELTNDEQKLLQKGVVVEGKVTASARISDVKAAAGKGEFQITIHEGRKRQVRLMLAGVGHKVIYLQRLRQGPLELGNLKTGTFRPLTESEITAIKKI